MLELEFNDFIGTYRKEFRIIKCTLHYVENEDEFKLVFKNHEQIEYFTIIKKQVIKSFGEQYDVDEEQSIKDFKLEYLDKAKQIYEESPQVGYQPPSIESIDDTMLGAYDDVMQKIIEEPGSDVVQEAKDYGDFMVKTVDKMEKHVLAALKHIDLQEKKKTFGEFLEKMMNVVNTKSFMVKVKHMIKGSMQEGMEAAEKELDINVTWTHDFNQKLANFENEQFNGYTINGKKWHGIKGATKEVQFKIRKQVDESLRNKDSKEELARQIKNIFEGSTTSQVKRIARTETTRFINEGKLLTYKESGIKGRKVWASVLDSHTSDIDRRLHNKYFNKGIGIDEPFIDDVTNKSFNSPPSHPNCRCVVEYRTVKQDEN